ncbi:hypothetical protein L9F63_002845 [Diploptera punctata]|uniref:Uncharacterized protein n=1 Tax=Diploptera punctata TaxID=6984 RepID=A0AAD7ZRG3_DIPPU|nr:hypothetical protein L9F63_002845 [Diploptera punctata]
MLLTLVVILAFSPTGALECPTKCRCSNYKTWCRYSRLQTLPLHLAATTLSLSIHYDDIKKLNTSMVSRTRLNNLTHLELNSVQLQQIEPGSFKYMNLLKKLIITNNNINRLHADTFKYLHNLHYLNLKQNKITYLHDGAFLDLVNMRYLYLEENRVPPLPANVFYAMKNNSKCKAMKAPGVLDINNKFSRFPSHNFGAFQQLCSFTKMSISGSTSTSIAKDAFVGTTRVRDLKLSFIPLVELTNIFNGLEKLTNLQITYTNALNNIEIGALENLTALKYLELSHNKLTSIRSGTFRCLQSLKVLKLDYTNISIIEKNAFKGLESLESLSLEYSKLTTMHDGIFESLTSLKELFIRASIIEQIDPDAFNSLSQIKIIRFFVDYNNKKIITLKNNTLSRLKTLSVVHLSVFKFSVEAGAFPEVWSIQIFSKNITHRLEDVYYPSINYEFALQRVTCVIMATFGDIHIRANVKSVQGHHTIHELYLLIKGEIPILQKQVYELLENMLNFTYLNIKITGLNSFETLASLSDLQISHLDISNCNSVNFKANSSFRFPNIQSLFIMDSKMLEIHTNAFTQLKSMMYIKMSHIQRVAIASGTFIGLNNLKVLEFHFNDGIVTIPTWTVSSQNKTRLPKMNKNITTTFEAGTFLGLGNLEILVLSRNGNISLTKAMFEGLHNIIEIDLSWNGIKEIIPGVFGAECVEYFKLSCKKCI